MNTVEIELSFKAQKGNKSNVTVAIEKDVLDKYVHSFATSYAKGKIDNPNIKWYRFGKMSGKVHFTGVTYKDCSEFSKSIPYAKEFAEHVLTHNASILNSEELHAEFGYGTWIDVYSYVFHFYEKEIEQAILKENGITEPIAPKPLQTKSYSYKGEDVIFFKFETECCGDTLYAVPVKVAEEHCIEDYNHENISRFEDILNVIDEYEVKEDLIVSADCVTAYNND